jgi:8-oxo-dGTP pyrophosphatase MutT (NUDIX family)
VRWTVHGERSLYDSPWVSLRLADVELPDGERFEHHLVRLPEPAASCVIEDPARGVLLLWRHRFITDTWGWEVPAGRAEPDEPLAEAAAREALEETGWRPIGPLEPLGSWFPTNGLCDQAFNAFRARGAVHVGDPVDAHESERVEWVPLAEVERHVAEGRVLDGFSLTSLLLALRR